MSIIHLIFLEIVFCFSIAAVPIYKIITKKEAFETKDFFQIWYEKQENALSISESGITMDTFMKILIIAPLALLVVGYVLTKNGVISVFAALSGFILPYGIVKLLDSRNAAKFDERYGRSLQQLASSLKAGMSILESVKDVAESNFVHPTIRKKYAAMSLDLQMGMSVSDAFHNFANKVNSKDARDTAIAIDVQNEVGGHEADVIEEIAENIHQRILLRKEIKTLFSGTTSMIWIMDFVPPLIMLIYLVGNRDMSNTYFNSPLLTLVLIGLVVMMVIGSFINHRTLNKVMKGE